jgi:RNA polymerase sigma factor (sigma-70 family)
VTETEALKQYEPWLHRLVQRYRHWGASEEDLLQEARLAFVLGFRRWREGAGANLMSFTTWYVKGALRKYLAAMACEMNVPLDRETGRFREHLKSTEFDDSRMGQSGEQEAECLRREQAELIAQVMQRLKPRDQEIVRLYFADEVSIIDIAARFGITKQRVDQVLKESLIKLRPDLERRLGNVA